MTKRFRITFEKNEEMKFIGHLDLYKTWIRTFRRAHLQLEHSQGYHPQPKIQLAAALPLGFTSSCEQMDVWILEELQPGELQTRAADVLPPGIQIRTVDEVSAAEKPLQVQLKQAEYQVEFLNPPEEMPLQKSIETLLNASVLPRNRKGKEYDLRPLVRALEWRTAPHKGLFMRLLAKESQTGRPEEVLLQLGYDPLSADIRRVQLIYE